MLGRNRLLGKESLKSGGRCHWGNSLGASTRSIHGHGVLVPWQEASGAEEETLHTHMGTVGLLLGVCVSVYPINDMSRLSPNEGVDSLGASAGFFSH